MTNPVIAPTLLEFLNQAQTDNLKFGHYPHEIDEFKSKVSFGQGVRARVPWISITGTGISTSNGYYPVYLYYRDENLLVLAFGISEKTEYGESWPEEVQSRFPRIDEVIDNPPRYGTSWVFKKYDVVSSPNGVNIESDGKTVSSQTIDSDLKEILDLYRTSLE